MKKFMDQDFLLKTDTAKELYHNVAAKLPIIDYHCHINPQELAEDKRFSNITQLWLLGDHYKWRAMRANGVDEKYVTGDASEYEKFLKWAETLEKLIGNPLYHWSHLELQRYFNYHGALNSKTAPEVWKLCEEVLKDPKMSAKNIVMNSNVTAIGTTDDPIDDLRWHKILKEDVDFTTEVLPTFRPDKAMNIEKVDYLEYIAKLEKVCGTTISTYRSLMDCLKGRIDFFNEMGCKASDHGLETIYYVEFTADEVEAIFKKRLNGENLTKTESYQFKTAFMLEMGKYIHEAGWVMQLHYNCRRDNNQKMFNKLGPDTGFDCINNASNVDMITQYLNALNMEDCLPKTIIYSLNPIDNAAIVTIVTAFNDGSIANKVQQGSAWWFNDHYQGMVDQMKQLASGSPFGNFVGMLTDSRSFLSYTRHEYFRRILCNIIGEWVENGEYPEDYDILNQLVSDISYNNTKNYFGFKR